MSDEPTVQGVAVGTGAPYGAPSGYGDYRPHPYGWYGPPPAAPPPGPEKRPRRIRFGLVMAAVLILAVGAGIGVGAWIAPTSPKTTAQALLSNAIVAGTNAGSFHYVELSTNDGAAEDITGVAGTDSGSQTITQGSSGTDVFNERLVDGVVYFRGNRAAVIDQLGVPAAKASSDANRWVTLHKGARLYSTFADGITAKSNLSQITSTFQASTSASVPSSSPPTTRIIGGLKDGTNHAPVGTGQVVVTTSSSLPKSLSAEAVADNGGRLHFTWTFNHWGEPVNVKAPAGAVAYSSLGATPPSRSG